MTTYHFLTVSFLLFFSVAEAQNVGIGTDTPTEKLDVEGAIRVGNTTTDNERAIRYNPTEQYHEGNVDGTATGWQKLENDWRLETGTYLGPAPLNMRR